MTVKQFLHLYNIGRSSITKATINNGNTEVWLVKKDIMDENYYSLGGSKVNSFTITEDEIILYV